jgi:DNA invertase Pin-like site-specific DNA recombinase
MIAQRVRAGLARARSGGKRLGRPPIAPTLEKRIREALAKARRAPHCRRRRFRTIQVCPKDLPATLQQVERAVNRPSAPRRRKPNVPHGAPAPSLI